MDSLELVEFGYLVIKVEGRIKYDDIDTGFLSLYCLDREYILDTIVKEIEYDDGTSYIYCVLESVDPDDHNNSFDLEPEDIMFGNTYGELWLEIDKSKYTPKFELIAEINHEDYEGNNYNIYIIEA